MIRSINGQPVPQPHSFSEIRTPASITVRCSCGWWNRFTRAQNALRRAAKIKGAMSAHLRDVEMKAS